MYALQDSENDIFVAGYYILLVVIMSFLMVNLFIAVVAEAFAKSREDNVVTSFLKNKYRPPSYLLTEIS